MAARPFGPRLGRRGFRVPRVLAAMIALVVAATAWPAAPAAAVTNGTTTAAGAAKHMVLIDAEGLGNCSGTYIGNRQVITARHCVEGATDASKLTVSLRNGETMETIEWHKNPELDVAIVILPRVPSGTSFNAVLASANPPVGTQLTLRGYGNSAGGSGSGTLREGGVTVSALAYNRVSARRGANGVSACPGDSGGGLFAPWNGGPVEMLYAVTSSVEPLDNAICPSSQVNAVSVANIRGWIDLIGEYYNGQGDCRNASIIAHAQGAHYVNLMIGGAPGSTSWGSSGGGGQRGGYGTAIAVSLLIDRDLPITALVGCPGTNPSGYPQAGTGWSSGGSGTGYGGGAGGGSSALCLDGPCTRENLQNVIALMGGGGGAGGGTCAGQNGWRGGHGGRNGGEAFTPQAGALAFGVSGSDAYAGGKGGDLHRRSSFTGRSSSVIAGGGGGGVEGGQEGTNYGGGCQSMGGGGGGASATVSPARFTAMSGFTWVSSANFAFSYSTLPITGAAGRDYRAIEFRSASGKCLSVQGGSPVVGGAAEIETCDATKPWQKWERQPDGRITAFADGEDGDALCLTADSGGIGAPVAMRRCSSSSGSSQVWTLRPNGNIVSTASGRCVAVKDASTVDGTVVVMGDCNQHADEVWSSPGALLSSLPITLEPKSSTDGTARSLTYAPAPAGSSDSRSRAVISSTTPAIAGGVWGWTPVDGSHGGGLLKNVATGTCLRWVGGSVQTVLDAGCDGSDQAFRWGPTIHSDGTMVLQSQAYGECLDVSSGTNADGAQVLAWGCHGGANQDWRVVVATSFEASSAVTLQPANSVTRTLAYAAAPAGSSDTRRRAVIAETLPALAAGRWVWVPVAGSNGGGLLRNVSTNSCLRWTGDNAPAVLDAQCNGADSVFRWGPTHHADGTMILQSQRDGKCLDVRNLEDAEGAVVESWTCNGGANQNWRPAVATPHPIETKRTLTLQPSHSSTRVLTYADAPVGAVDRRKQAVISSTFPATAADLWTWTAIDGSNGGGVLRNAETNTCLRWYGGDQQAVLDAGCNGADPTFRWAPTVHVDGTMILQSQHDGRCLDVFGTWDSDGAPVLAYTCTGKPNQNWTALAR
ncbi:ricin-type beta-trefoil lectin domain protein [Leifsonia poae]|uniref:ricin-type beta-trefoil lectin domain protein n=1 Tax=Leifsonia poae TaxID=110933 RepID=UPI003D680CD5